MPEWTIELPGVPKSMNALLRGSTTRIRNLRYAEERDRWTEVLWGERLRLGLKSAERPRRIRVTFYFPRPARRDPMNFCHKAFIDALVRAGWLADDDDSHLTGIEAHCVYDPERGPQTVITIIEDEGASVSGEP